MITKTLIAATTALVVASSFASVANAQRVQRQQQAVQPFTEAERNWFELATGRDDGMHRF